jgi:hypothetical protein
MGIVRSYKTLGDHWINLHERRAKMNKEPNGITAILFCFFILGCLKLYGYLANLGVPKDLRETNLEDGRMDCKCEQRDCEDDLGSFKENEVNPRGSLWFRVKRNLKRLSQFKLR